MVTVMIWVVVGYKGWGGVHFKAPSLAVKGAFGVAPSSRLASLALDCEPRSAPGHAKPGAGWER